MEKPDVVMDGAGIVAVIGEGAEARGTGFALLEVQEDPAHELQITLHGAMALRRVQSDVGVPSAR